MEAVKHPTAQGEGKLDAAEIFGGDELFDSGAAIAGDLRRTAVGDADDLTVKDEEAEIAAGDELLNQSRAGELV